MNISDYWIGDHVIILSLNRKGRFEGIDHSGKAIVRTSDKMILVESDDLQVYDEPQAEVSPKLIVEDNEMAFSPIKAQDIIDYVIDLHYEKLAPERQRNPHTHIIEFQIAKCTEYIETAIQRKFPFIRIIHGRGQGKLKAAVEQLLKNYPEVNLVSSTPDSGALEIWMR